jgi:hypothetical protein
MDEISYWKQSFPLLPAQGKRQPMDDHLTVLRGFGPATVGHAVASRMVLRQRDL